MDFVWSGPVGPVKWNLAIISKFHYTGPTGPDRTGFDQTRVSDKVRGRCLVGSGPFGSGRARVVEFSYNS